MYFGSSFTFGLLLLIRASFAQSAPYYQDTNEDEEALIDRLASLAAVVGSGQLGKQSGYANYDLPPYLGDLNDEILTKEYVAKLPRQFGYKPDDVRFYMPAEQFPPNLSRDEKADSPTHFRMNGANIQNYDSSALIPNIPNNVENVPNVQPPPQQYFAGDQQQQTGGNTLEEEHPMDNGHFMKKNDMKDDLGSHHQNIMAEPSNLMASDHSVEKPFHNLYPIDDNDQSFSYSDIYYIGLIAGCSAAVVIGLVAAGIFWYRIHQRVKAAAEVDYPAYGVTGPSKDVSPSGGDRKLAQSAQMYHYQHQKQQMAALQKGALQNDRQGGSDAESEDDNEDDNDYTVYECPGLAPAGEMEVKNPLFEDEPTPATPQTKHDDEK